MQPPPGFEYPIYVTRPLLPALERYSKALEGIWSRRWLTNKGPLHDELELALCRYLHVKQLSLVANGTLALALALKALEIDGEVVTTPLTSPATVDAVLWAGLTPVFADIHPHSLTLDPHAAEARITPRTSAILGVHIYGIPCDVNAFERIATRKGLHVVYDAAHGFGTEIDGRPLADFGDVSILSFHATKLFNTGEGGAVVSRNPEVKRRVDLLRTLGLADETTVLLPGLNARMNELEAALGLANLEVIDAERSARSALARLYRTHLSGIEDLSCVDMPASSQHYFVIRVHAGCLVSRDALYEGLKRFNIFARRYFYPLCSTFPFLAGTATAADLPVATRVANEVLCLPFYGDLGAPSVERICDAVHYIVASRG